MKNVEALAWIFREDLSRLHVVAVVGHMLDVRIGIDGFDGFIREQQAADHAVALGVDLSGLDRIVPDQEPAGRIAGTDLLPQSLFNVGSDHEAIKLHVFFLLARPLELQRAFTMKASYDKASRLS